MCVEGGPSRDGYKIGIVTEGSLATIAGVYVSKLKCFISFIESFP